MSAAVAQQDLMDGAVRHIVTNYSPKGNRVGWLMLASILVEAWAWSVKYLGQVACLPRADRLG